MYSRAGPIAYIWALFVAQSVAQFEIARGQCIFKLYSFYYSLRDL